MPSQTQGTISAKDLREDMQSVFLLGLKVGTTARQLAEQAAGSSDSYLRGKDAFERAYSALLSLPNSSQNGRLQLAATGNVPTPAGAITSEWRTAKADRASLFDEIGANGPTILVIDVTGIDEGALWKDAANGDPAIVKGGTNASLAFFETSLGLKANKSPDPSNGTLQVLHGQDVSLKRRGNTSRWDRKINLNVALDGDPVSGFPKQINLLNCIRDPAYERVRLAWALMAEARCPAEPNAYAELRVNGEYHGTYVAMPSPDEYYFHQLFPKVTERAVFRGQFGDDISGGATLAYRGSKGSDYFTSKLNPTRRTYEPRLDTSDQAYDALAKFIDLLNKSADAKTDAFAKSLLEIFDVAGFLRTMVVVNLLGAWDNYYLNAQNYFLHIALSSELPGTYISFCAYDLDSVLGVSWPGQKRNWQQKDILFRGTEQGDIVLVKRVLENPLFRNYYCDFMAWFVENRFTLDWFATRRAALWKRLEQSVYLESTTPSGPPSTARPWTNDQVYRHAVGDQTLDAPGGGTVAGLQVLGIGDFVQQRRAKVLELLKQEQLGKSGVFFSTNQWAL